MSAGRTGENETAAGRIARRLIACGCDDHLVDAIAFAVADEIDRLEARYDSHIHHTQNSWHTRGPVEPE